MRRRREGCRCRWVGVGVMQYQSLPAGRRLAISPTRSTNATGVAPIWSMNMSPWRHVRLGDLTPVVDERPDGSVVMRARQPLGRIRPTLTERLERWASEVPDRTLLAWRAGSALRAHDVWRRARRRSGGSGRRSSIGDCPPIGRSPSCPATIIQHLLLALAAQHVGVPYAPISPAYSLMSSDFGALKQCPRLLSPGLVFASNAERFKPSARCRCQARRPNRARLSERSTPCSRRGSTTRRDAPSCSRRA